jgi:ribonuclease D
LKKAWHLSGAQLVVLQRLCAWREFTARDEDVPRNRVVWDDHLYEFAKVPNLTLDAVHAALPQVVARRYGDALVDAHRDGGDSTLLEPLDRPLTSRQGAQVKQLKSVGLEVARARELAPELICRKRDLESCVRHHAATGELSPVYSNWRKDLVGGQFLQVLNGG